MQCKEKVRYNHNQGRKKQNVQKVLGRAKSVKTGGNRETIMIIGVNLVTKGVCARLGKARVRREENVLRKDGSQDGRRE